MELRGVAKEGLNTTLPPPPLLEVTVGLSRVVRKWVTPHPPR